MPHKLVCNSPIDRKLNSQTTMLKNRLMAITNEHSYKFLSAFAVFGNLIFRPIANSAAPFNVFELFDTSV